MTPLSRILLAATTGAALITGTGIGTDLTATKAQAATRSYCTSSVPYIAGKGGYDTYRIPAAVTTRKGTLLAFAEGRHGGAGDSGNIDVVLRRSTDGGCTWGPLSVVAAGRGDTRGNPAPVVDEETGRIVLVTSYNDGAVTEAQIMRGEVTPQQSRRVFVQTSSGTNDGRRFTPPRDITAQVKLPNWRWYATGPGHAVYLSRGPHTGRIVIPSNHSAAPPTGSPDTGQESKYYGGHAIYSDNVGRTWHLGFVDDSYDGIENANETSAAQLPDGRLYFSSRDQNGLMPGNRLDSYSSDGGESLDRPYSVQPTLNDVPIVQGSVLQLWGGSNALLFAGPSEPTERRSMAIWRSEDGGETFEKALTLSDRRAAYSDLVRVDRRLVGVLYETGTEGTYESIEFRRVVVGGVG
ncbi:exo-alpha-sialidase [Streptomyces sp. SID12501]|uniref:exo-alpha-sialidase n=1 Tax=Streptomyces sp. SID12501 TaxID=2706042 RepID=A0A6B3C1M1_9ACTN|nr:sialidase family protein [Streptomyces sp. SID12501]NEC90336.1 exo-alpha-sialidase [Streptomyces sp. SID12501]